MCKKCGFQFPLTANFYTTRKGKVITHICRACHSELLRKRYHEKKALGYRLRMVKEEIKEEIKEENQKEAPERKKGKEQQEGAHIKD